MKKSANHRLREQAKSLFLAAVERADPALSLKQHLASAAMSPLPEGGRNILIALGKAAVPMMRAALEEVSGPSVALVVTNPENRTEIVGARVICGSHPVPDADSERAGREIIALLKEAGQNDRVIALISGGGSALAIAPADGLTLEDKQETNKLLLSSGLEINQMNLIRQQLSDLKGGGFLHHAAPARVHAFILSDVIGDDLRAIASGPTVSPIGTRQQARNLLEDAGIWDAVPARVQAHLNAETKEIVSLPGATNTLIGSNRHSLKAMLSKAATEEWSAKLITHRLVGDVEDAAELVVSAAEVAPRTAPVALVFGGETTVRLKGSGLGGRNQELALRVAHSAKDRLSGDWVFLSGGTDGRDGPTDAAGGVVDAGTVQRIEAQGGVIAALLANNDSYQALKLSGDLLMTGGTGTNVADVQVFLRLPEE